MIKLTIPDPPTPTNNTIMIKLSSSPPTLTIPVPPTPTTDTTLLSPITTVPTGTTITSVPPTSRLIHVITYNRNKPNDSCSYVITSNHNNVKPANDTTMLPQDL
ncbi:unnamed protein product [Rhizophagus irregularis]|uniref:Uncharacterized protein n=1 Tax=Rhizophagus irregularis TaxID=588596 RepID=A0A2I1FTJ8_9GLOM|nr:hypothetical protein RhiirA4_253594 [Rhizophagus irregularis]CAB4434352.1 unnamed protein product [Rhizophagus irregularis]CAB4434581.1 unnamed protein product [Rhizophagus irregularis]